MQLKIRQIEQKDIGAMVDLIHEAWFKGTYSNEAFEKAASTISLNKALYHTTIGRVAEVDGEILGLILCAVKDQEPIYRQFQAHPLDPLIELSSHGNNEEFDRLIETFKAECTVYDQFLEEIDQSFDASIEYIAVSSKAQGKGIGKSLIFESLQEFKQEACRNLYLFTDTDCNYKFYDYLDFDRIAQSTIDLPTQEGSRQREEFMYAYSLD